jgi:hypothetical protein
MLRIPTLLPTGLKLKTVAANRKKQRANKAQQQNRPSGRLIFQLGLGKKGTAGFYKRQCQEKVLPPRRRGG